MTTILLLLISFLFNIPACATEDSTHCYWDASVQGNGQGASFISLSEDAVLYLP